MTFVDPRTKPTPPWTGASRPPTGTVAHVTTFVAAITGGRFYDVEQWIADGRPLQFKPPGDPRKTPLSPLCAAIDTGQYDVVVLLLCNGYDTELEEVCPFSAALSVRRYDIVDLLLAWGSTPSPACVKQVVSCYDTKVIEKLWRCGIDLSAQKALAGAVASSTRNLPLYGFLKRHRLEDPRLQRGLDVGLCRAVERENEKAVSLCVWAGADPWAQVRLPWYRESVEDEVAEDEAWSADMCAAGHAILRRRSGLLRLMRLRADARHFQELYSIVWDVEDFDVLYRIAPPEDLSGVAERALGHLWVGLSDSNLRLLRRSFELGGRIEQITDYQARNLRDQLRRASAWSGRKLVQLLQDPTHVAEAVFLKIIHSPKVIDNAKELGITMQNLEKLAELPTTSSSVRAAARRPLRKWRRREQRLAAEARRAAARASS